MTKRRGRFHGRSRGLGNRNPYLNPNPKPNPNPNPNPNPKVSGEADADVSLTSRPPSNLSPTGGSTYCAVAAVALMDPTLSCLTQEEKDGLVQWCLARQVP